MSELLALENIHKHYGGVAALKNAHFTLRAGEVHALMGENGAGKSTLAKIIAGSVNPDSGRTLIDGKPVSIANPLDAQRLGIGVIYQELDLFPHLTVAENIVIGNLEFESRSVVNFSALDRFCEPLLKQVGLRCSPRRILGSLNIGQMQLVAIARALSTQARVIVMDEPTSSLFEDGVSTLFQLIANLKQRGVAIIYVSHKMDEIYRICDRATILRDGVTIGTRELAETSIDELIGMMVGRELEHTGTSNRENAGDVVLSVTNLTTSKLRDVGFVLKKGEVLGVAGLVGAGRSELGAALFGLDPWLSGEIHFNGRLIKPRSAREAMDLGIGLLPEDRKLQGLMMRMSVLENSTLPVLGKLQLFGWVREAREIAAVKPVFETLRPKTRSFGASVSSLSGGNQQKVLIAKCLLATPDVLFLDDPTRGIDVGAKHDIYQLIAKLASESRGIIFVSSELPELLRCCDRILVMKEGRITATFEADAASQEAIMSAAS
jgi:ABC-type sugar transport system ATPase subunit